MTGEVIFYFLGRWNTTTHSTTSLTASNCVHNTDIWGCHVCSVLPADEDRLTFVDVQATSEPDVELPDISDLDMLLADLS